jgi:hypothetical protein
MPRVLDAPFDDTLASLCERGTDGRAVTLGRDQPADGSPST